MSGDRLFLKGARGSLLNNLGARDRLLYTWFACLFDDRLLLKGARDPLFDT